MELMTSFPSIINKRMGEIYFGVKKTQKFFFDEADKEQWIEFKKLSEGERVAYEDSIAGKISFDQESGKAEMESKIGSDRKSLIENTVCGYNVKVGKAGEVVTGYDKAKWEELYQQMDADMAEKLFKEIKDFNGFGKKKS
jgi:hypothetical protein